MHAGDNGPEASRFPNTPLDRSRGALNYAAKIMPERISMPRIAPVFRPADYPGEPDAQTATDLSALFAAAFPGVSDPAFDKGHTGNAIAAHSPAFAAKLAAMTRTVVLDLPFGGRADLVELAIQAVNLHFGCDFTFEARLPLAEAKGVGKDRIAALALWRTSSLFDEDQRLVIAYALAAASGRAPDDVCDQVAARFGQRGLVELTAIVGTFALWAMLVNASGISFAD